MTQAERKELRETWRERLAAFHASGLSGAAWCAANGIKPHQFWYWIRRFREESAPTASPPEFLPVYVQDPHSVSGSQLLVRVGSVSIEVHPGYDKQLLRDLVETLVELC